MPDPAAQASGAEPMPLVVVGCGLIARAYLQALTRVPDLQLCAFVDRDERASGSLAATHPVTTFTTLEALWQAGVRPNAALVLTPPDTHEALSTWLLQHGVHVLCEKPLAPSIAAAERMLGVARQSNRRLMMGSKFRYTADVHKAHQLLESGFCGDTVLYENVFCSHVDMTQRWNAKAIHSGGGVLVVNGCHSVDLARFLLGPIARVQAQFGKRAQPIDVEDTARLLFTSENGTLGSIDLSWSMHKETLAYVRIHGTRGTIEIGWQQSRCKATGTSEWQVFGNGYDKVAAFAAQLANFAGVLNDRETAVIDDADALASVVVVDCAYRSQREERWLPVPTPH
jgi:predicted dehydrogenase